MLDDDPYLEKIPVAVFTYNRPFHTQRIFQALSQCRGLERCVIYIFCDGPKTLDQHRNVRRVHEIIQEWAPRLHANVVIREENLGLARSIVSGVSELCNRYGRVIVLEDDLVPSIDFIDYMVRALDLFQNAPDVYQVSGYMFPIEVPEKTDTLFLPITTSWGWATWDRAWRIFNWNAPGWEDFFESSRVRKQFDLDDSYPYYQMFKARFEGNNDSWAILWWYAVFRANGLVLYPTKSLIWVGGFDGTGTHCGTQDIDQALIEEFSQLRFPEPIEFPEVIVADDITFNTIKKHLKLQKKITGNNLVSAFRRILRKTIHKNDEM